jgi:G6PDH family F420-dependent oxidoreductase
MLEEAVDVMRRLWTGEFVTHYGKHYTVEQARLYTLPDTPPQIHISGFGPKSATLAGRIGDGYVTTSPDEDMITVFRENGGAGKPLQAGYKVCWGTDDDACIEVAHSRWANESLPGELAQVLPSPRHFEQASSLVTPDKIRESIAYGSAVDRHIEAFRPYAKAGFDLIHISQIGADRKETNAAGFFDFYGKEVLPELRKLG